MDAAAQSQRSMKRTAAKLMRRKDEGSFSAASFLSGAGDTVSVSSVQTKALLLLGRLGGAARFVVGSISDAVADAAAWESSGSLIQLPLTLNGTLCTVALDGMLPILAESATAAPDKQTKFAAAELLHAIVTFIIGSTGLQRGAVSSGKFSPLLKRVFPVCLRLGSDVDGVCCKLYETLVMQCARYIAELFRHGKEKEDDEGSVMLDACLESLCADSTGLRSLASSCVNEFVRFSLKTGSTGESEKVAYVIRRILAYARHSSAFARLGACAAINSM